MGSSWKWVILNGLEYVGLIGLQVGSGQPYFHMKLKKKKHVLPLGKSCNKLLNLRCITLNSPPISRKSSTQQIDICSIIIKLYKSANPNIANQNK